MSLDNNPLITQICLQDVDKLIENLCFFWDTPEKTEVKWKRHLYVTEINDIWIHEKYRGVGLGTALIYWFEALSKDKGCKKVDGPCMIHRHFRPGNMIVYNGKLVDVIDWASARFSFAEQHFCSGTETVNLIV